jgi:putative ABC transport system permease protein
MAHRVPLARRNLLADPRRLVASVFGVGLALMLILLLDGLWSGIQTRVTIYEDHSGADLYVAQAGTKNFFGGISSIPVETTAEVRSDPDVDWAAPVRGLFTIVELHDRKVPVYLIGSEQGERGGAWSISEGRAPETDDEVVVGRGLVDRHGLGLGDTLQVLGQPFTVVGIDSQADAFMASFAFLTHSATDELLNASGTTSFILVGTDNPDVVRSRLAEKTGLAVLDVDELRDSDRALLTRAYGVPIRVMVAIAFGAGSLVIALTTYAAITERRREYGIVKAMGASGTQLTRLALSQSLALAVAGMAAGWLLFLLGRALIIALRPQFSIVTSPTIGVRAAVAALVMGLVAAIVPARRLATIDPSTAYRGG